MHYTKVYVLWYLYLLLDIHEIIIGKIGQSLIVMNKIPYDVIQKGKKLHKVFEHLFML